MTNRIIFSKEESQRITQAQLTLTTYSNYVKAWFEGITRVFGDDENRSANYIEKIKQTNNYSKIRITQLSPEIRNAYIRSKLTLKAISVLQIDTHPDLAKLGYLWLPVQSYYSIHGAGSALIMALNMPYNNTHAHFLTLISQVMVAYMPALFCANCFGGPEITNYVFDGLDTSADAVKNLQHLSNPQKCENIDDFIGKTLSTTRSECLRERFKKTRKGKNKHLSSTVKANCCQNEHPTSVVDLLYRLRCQSNYDNPDMFLFGNGDELAVERYKTLAYLVKFIVDGLDILLEKALGADQINSLRRDID
jgi:hypothetical protein